MALSKLKNQFEVLNDVDDLEDLRRQLDSKSHVKKKPPEASNLARDVSALSLSENMGNAIQTAKESDQDGDKDRKGGSKLESLKSPLVWIDLEMTGLDIEKDRILEIACIVTDGKLTTLIEGPDLIISQPDESLASMGEWCQHHHNISGLTESVRNSNIVEHAAEMEVLKFIQQYTVEGKAQLAGNSVYTDLLFMRKYMPTLASHFSHVLVDVSTVRALCSRWFPKDASKLPAKQKKHRALEDIKESIAELKYLRKAIFKDPQKAVGL